MRVRPAFHRYLSNCHSFQLQGMTKYWTTALIESDPLTDIFVNATVLDSIAVPYLNIYASPGFGQIYNSSNALPTPETAIWKSGVLHCKPCICCRLSASTYQCQCCAPQRSMSCCQSQQHRPSKSASLLMLLLSLLEMTLQLS